MQTRDDRLGAARDKIVMIRGHALPVEWTAAAADELGRRSCPLVVELELYFSCLVKKFVHFHDVAPKLPTVVVNEQLLLCFHVVTSSACTMDEAARLGRQPEVELDTAATRKLRPKSLSLDFVRGAWVGSFQM